MRKTLLNLIFALLASQSFGQLVGKPIDVSKLPKAGVREDYTHPQLKHIKDMDVRNINDDTKIIYEGDGIRAYFGIENTSNEYYNLWVANLIYDSNDSLIRHGGNEIEIEAGQVIEAAWRLSDVNLKSGDYKIAMIAQVEGKEDYYWIVHEDDGQYFFNFTVLEETSGGEEPELVFDKPVEIKNVISEGSDVYSDKPIELNFQIRNIGTGSFNESLNIRIATKGINEFYMWDTYRSTYLPANSYSTEGQVMPNLDAEYTTGSYEVAVSYIDDEGVEVYIPWIDNGEKKYRFDFNYVVREDGGGNGGGSLSQDTYEDNESIDRAWPFYPEYNALGLSSLNLEPTNLHSDEDMDYYKIKLEAGFNYAVKTIVEDKISDPENYSLDIAYDFRINDGEWTRFIDDEARTVNLSVAEDTWLYTRFYTLDVGETGTYFVKWNITREVATSLNPVVFNSNGFGWNVLTNTPIGEIRVYDVLGNLVVRQAGAGEQGYVSMESLTRGMYIIRVLLEDGTQGEKLITK